MDHHSERVLDLNIQGTTAVYVLISSLTTANCAAVQIPKAGVAAVPPQASRHDGTSATAVRAAAAHGAVGCARHRAEGKREAASLWKLLICSEGTKLTKTKLCPFSQFSWQSHS